MTRTSILFAIPSLDKGGPDRVFHELIRRIDRTRFAPSLVVSRPDGYYMSRLPADVEVHQLGAETGVSSRYPVVPLARLVRTLRPDVVLATLRMGLTAGLARPLFPRKTRLFVRPANHPSRNRRELIRAAPLKHRVSFALERYALGRADHLICQSDDLAHDLGKLGVRPPMTVIGNPIDVDEVNKMAGAGAELPGDPALLAVGRLCPQKGFDVLLEAFASLARRMPAARLTVVGTGPDEAALRRQSDELGVADRVTFRGFVENPYPLMRAADLYVLSSRYEGFPNVALEALAIGTPVVATSCPGVGGLVLPGVNGWLAEVEDAHSLADAMTAAALARARFGRDEVRHSVRVRYETALIVERYERALVS